MAQHGRKRNILSSSLRFATLPPFLKISLRIGIGEIVFTLSALVEFHGTAASFRNDAAADASQLVFV